MISPPIDHITCSPAALTPYARLQLLTASNDNVLSINPISDSVEDITRKIMDQDQAYWAKRVFAFLKKLPDLKTAVKDNRLLLDFERHYK